MDVSGFTAIAETLMQHGREGEVLADVVSSIFDPLVRSVYEQGGFIASFAGDAFTALFPKKQDEGDSSFTRSVQPSSFQRALTAAWQIQQHIAATSRYSTPYGAFTFAARLGLADGQTEWGILPSVNQKHHVYYFKGEAIDGCAQAEQQAASGEMIVSRAAYEALHHLIHPIQGVQGQVEPVANGFRVIGVPGNLLPPQTPSVDPIPSAAQHAAAFFAPELLQLSVRGEFRHVASLFINLKGQPGQEELATFVRPFFDLLDLYGGYLCRLDFGDKGCRWLLFWGAPTSFENDLERALNFVLDLQQATPDTPLRAGLTYQMAYAGFVGAARREEYTCYSSRVNLAARLMMAAPWASIWLDEFTADRASKFFEVEPVGAFAFKGFADKQPVLALRARRAPRGTRFYHSRLVGRKRELARLRDFVAPIFQGRFAGELTVYGEAGIGKSRLLYEFKRVCQTMDHPPTWFLCQTDQTLRQSLNPFRYFLRTYFDQPEGRRHATTHEENKQRFDRRLDILIARTPDPALRAELERMRSFLGALVGLYWPDSLYNQLEPKLRFQNTLDAIKTLLKAASLYCPVVLQIEDIDWLDADSVELLRRLTHDLVQDRGPEGSEGKRAAERPSGYPLALLASSRTEPAPDLFDPGAPQQAFDPGALTMEDVQLLAEDVLEGPAAPSLVTLLFRHTGGNPFFVEQVLLYMKKQGLLTRSRDGFLPREQGVMVPTDVHVVLTARLDRLAQNVKQVVQTAAVLGREFQVQVLSHMLQHDDQLPAKVKQAEAEAIWSALPQKRYMFKHTLLRDAAYDMQLRTRLQELHAQAGAAIEQVYAADLGPHYADLAYHYGKAGDTERERHYARLAGEQAAARFANTEALAYLSRALGLTPEKDYAERYALLLAREEVYDRQGARPAQEQDLIALADLAERLGGATLQAQVALRWANYADMTGNYSAAIVVAHRAVTLAQATGVAESETAGYLAWGRSLWQKAGYALARPRLEQALALARVARLPSLEADSLRNLGIIAWYQGDFAEAQAYLDPALRLYRENGDRRGESATLHSLGLVARDRGDYAEAWTYLEQSLRMFCEIGEQWGGSMTIVNLGNVLLQQGDYVRARDYYEQALRLCREIGNRQGESEALSSLGLLFHLLGDNEAARDYSQQTLLVARDLGARNEQASALTHLGHALLGLGRLDEAADAYQQALSLRRELGQHNLAIKSLAGLARTSLAQGDTVQALAHVEEILSYLDTHTLDATEDPSQVYLTCILVLRANSDPRTQDVLNTAYRLLQEQAAKITDERLRHSFLENVPAHRELIAAWVAQGSKSMRA